MKIPIFEYWSVRPLQKFGLTGKFWTIHLDTLIYTWIAMLILFSIVYVARIFIKKKLNPFSLAVEQSVETFVDLCKESFGTFNYDYFAFVTTIFFFVLFCNLVGSLPFIEEPTKDLNTAFACGLAGFFYVQYQEIRIDGFWKYLKGYAKPIFVLLPINIISEFAKAISMSFRLFGNILGGSIVLYILIGAIGVYKEYIIFAAIGIFIMTWLFKKFFNGKYKHIHLVLNGLQFLLFSVASIQIFFGAFEAVIQAFVITMLVTTYLSMVVKTEEDVAPDEKEKKENSLDQVKGTV